MNNTVEVWAKPLPAHKIAILVVNIADADATLTISLAGDVPGKPQGTTMRDVWNHKEGAIEKGQIPITLSAHDSFFVVLSNTGTCIGSSC
jgi:hypothetical protein